MQQNRYSYMYLMESVKDRLKSFDEYAELKATSNIKLLSYKVHGYTMDTTNKDVATVDLTYKIEVTNNDTKEVIEKNNVKWQAIRENNIWKIKSQFDLTNN